MIPYFQFVTIFIGPVPIHVWGLMVALGIIAAVLLMTRLARKQLLSEAIILDMAIWVLIGAFIFARVFDVVFYNWAYYLAHPVEVFQVWQGGMSSFGGFFGAALALWLFAKRRHLTLKDLWPYFDISALGLWLAWGIGRIGCFLIHDHPGIHTSFFLAVQYPDGTRFDLGLYESILGFLLFIIFGLLFKRLTKIRSGFVMIWSALSYAVARFFLDFLRATDLPGSDARYFHLTPAQWGMLFLIVVLTSVLIFGRMKRRKSSQN